MDIEFVCLDEKYFEVYEAPVPASSIFPLWHKNKEVYTGDGKEFGFSGHVNGTTKSCSGIIDSLVMGYLFLLPCDISVGIDGNNNPFFNWKSSLYNHVTGFDVRQASESGLDMSLWNPFPFKFETQWVTKTPEGYSCIIQHPWWRDEVPFWTLPGIVDTDSYNSPTNFPFMLRKDFEGIIPCGTPIAQVIPFKREEWASSVVLDDGSMFVAHSKDNRFMENMYKRLHHSPKVFK